MQEFQEDFQKENLKSFQDRPDEIKDVQVEYTTDTEILISWECPDSNNSEIKSFKIYISESDIQSHRSNSIASGSYE